VRSIGAFVNKGAWPEGCARFELVHSDLALLSDHGVRGAGSWTNGLVGGGSGEFEVIPVSSAEAQAWWRHGSDELASSGYVLEHFQSTTDWGPCGPQVSL
jgi:hypothetical protein